MPDGAVYVGRGSRWGNPFAVGGEYRVRHWGVGLRDLLTELEQIGLPARREVVFRPASRREAVVAYLAWLRFCLFIESPAVGLPPIMGPSIDAALAGHDLACWCPLDDACHADVLLAVAAGTHPCDVDLDRVTPAVRGGTLL